MDKEQQDGVVGGIGRVLVGAAAVGAAAGVAYFFGRRFIEDSEEHLISDAPESTLRGRAGRNAPTRQSVTINKPRDELYSYWRDFPNLARFMDNVVSIERLDAQRSRWIVKAPAGTEVTFTSRVTEEVPGSRIGWETEPDSEVQSKGIVSFEDAPPGRGTVVRAIFSYEAPGGALGRAAAKLLQREPNVQARRDLRRFKQLMETGEVTSSAGPSARRSEEPTRQYL